MLRFTILRYLSFMDTPDLKDKIFDAIALAVQEVLTVDTTVSRDDLFIETYGMDSLDAIEVVIEVEEALDVSINEDRLAHVRTVNDFVEAVYAQLHDNPKK